MQVSFYATLRAIVGGRVQEVNLPEGSDVRNLVDEIARRWPELQEHLFDETGSLSRRVNIFVEGRNVRWLAGLDTKLLGNPQIALFPPVAGG